MTSLLCGIKKRKNTNDLSCKIERDSTDFENKLTVARKGGDS